MTSAPKSPSTVAASGPAKSVAASMILIPSSARLPSKVRPPSPKQFAPIFAHEPYDRKVLTGPRLPCYVGDALCVLRGRGGDGPIRYGRSGRAGRSAGAGPGQG